MLLEIDAIDYQAWYFLIRLAKVTQQSFRKN